MAAAAAADVATAAAAVFALHAMPRFLMVSKVSHVTTVINGSTSSALN